MSNTTPSKSDKQQRVYRLDQNNKDLPINGLCWSQIKRSFPIPTHYARDSQFSQLHQYDPSVVCTIDRDWIWDRIPIEDLEIPTELQPFNPDDDDALLIRQSAQQAEEAKRWSDLDLARFMAPQRKRARY
ncbi:hypothetical protein BDF19DRAFT_416033 [Syncephalis fuscata]|nr:hypothetical protein BDF19DRAFT_416033 [Syncephalis fuscata]